MQVKSGHQDWVVDLCGRHLASTADGVDHTGEEVEAALQLARGRAHAQVETAG